MSEFGEYVAARVLLTLGSGTNPLNIYKVTKNGLSNRKLFIF